MYDDADFPPFSRFLHIYRYPFNETAGSAQVIDYSGNVFHAAAIHGPSFSGSSMGLRWGQYLSIDTALAPVIKTLDSFTATFNVRIPQWSSTRPRVFNFGTSDDVTSMALFPYDWDGPYGITYYTTGPDLKGEKWCRTRSLPIDHNTFYAMAITYDGPSATFRTYRDGQETGACHDFPYKPSAQPLCTQLFIGRSTHSVYHEYFNSEFRCFRMYNRALTAEEIRRDPCYTGIASGQTTVSIHDAVEAAANVIKHGETEGAAEPVHDAATSEAIAVDAVTTISNTVNEALDGAPLPAMDSADVKATADALAHAAGVTIVAHEGAVVINLTPGSKQGCYVIGEAKTPLAKFCEKAGAATEKVTIGTCACLPACLPQLN